MNRRQRAILEAVNSLVNEDRVATAETVAEVAKISIAITRSNLIKMDVAGYVDLIEEQVNARSIRRYVLTEQGASALN